MKGVPEKLDITSEKTCQGIFTKAAGCRPAALQKMNFFTGTFQRFCLPFWNTHFKETFHSVSKYKQQKLFEVQINCLVSLNCFAIHLKTLVVVRGVSTII